MYKELSILSVFFENPLRKFHLREVARLTKMNHMTVRKYLHRFVQEGMLQSKKSRLWTTYAAHLQSKKWTNLKLYYNLEKLRESDVVEDLEHYYDFPIIVLFGSYAKANDIKESDIDLCIITNISKGFSEEKYQKVLKRKLSLHHYSMKEFQNLKAKNPELVNSICNGLVLSGQLEVV